ncbi:MAG: hypothetical protein AAGI22_03125 [Planctomycetota bacterium]
MRSWSNSERWRAVAEPVPSASFTDASTTASKTWKSGALAVEESTTGEPPELFAVARASAVRVWLT